MEEIISNVSQTPENTNPNVLRDQLQSIAGDKLPPVGPDDKGKVLTTNEITGAPEWAEASGGGGGSGGVEYVTFTEVGNAWTHDKSYSAILEAYNAGKLIVAVFNNTSSIMTGFVGIGGQTGFVTTTITDPDISAVGSGDLVGFTYWKIVILDGQTFVTSSYAHWGNPK